MKRSPFPLTPSTIGSLPSVVINAPEYSGGTSSCTSTEGISVPDGSSLCSSRNGSCQPRTVVNIPGRGSVGHVLIQVISDPVRRPKENGGKRRESTRV